MKETKPFSIVLYAEHCARSGELIRGEFDDESHDVEVLEFDSVEEALRFASVRESARQTSYNLRAAASIREAVKHMSDTSGMFRDSGDEVDDDTVSNFVQDPEEFSWDGTIIGQAQEAYDEATGQWTGCRWTTDHWTFKLDLDGVTPQEAGRNAERVAKLLASLDSVSDELSDIASSWDRSDDRDLEQSIEEARLSRIDEHLSTMQDDWLRAVEWLTEVEQNAKDAETHAKEALEHAREGRYQDAADSAESARECEATYGDSPIWGNFAAHMSDLVD